MRRPVLIACLGIAVAAALGTVAEAQTIGECPLNPTTIRRPACPDGMRFEDGECRSGPNWLGHRSHCPLDVCNTCRDGEELVVTVVEAVCSSRGPLVRSGTPACPEGFRFEGGECRSGPNWLGHRSHCPLEACAVCREDQMLDPEHGLCCDIPF
jgi:hypothetical protein